MLDALLWDLAIPVLLAGFVAVFALPAQELGDGRGRHISLPLVRRIGRPRTRGVRTALLILGFLSFLVGDPLVPAVWIVWNVWILDDWLYREDDDDRKRRYEWARVRIRMPKPVRLRPVERTAPA